MTWTILNANANCIPLADQSVQCVVTSPPYWGLRDYGQVGQIGLEPTPEAYVERIVAVFAEVWRVLRDDGTCWVNLGDSYAGSQQSGGKNGLNGLSNGPKHLEKHQGKLRDIPSDLKPKDLVGIPWRVAFALQAAGWYLRSDIIWSKPNPMPESVTDRPTKAHEYIFLLTKKERYFFDQDAVRENAEQSSGGWQSRARNGESTISVHGLRCTDRNDGGECIGDGRALSNRNIRTVWEINYDNDITTQWIGKIGFCQRCNGVRIVGNGSEPMISKDTGDSKQSIERAQENSERTESPTKSLSVPLGRDSQLTIFAATEDASIRPTLSPSQSKKISTEETLPPEETKPKRIVRMDMNTALQILTSAVTVDGTAVHVCDCAAGDNSLKSVWDVATQPFPNSHFATFPEEIAIRCIKAGTSEKGACAECGAPWERVTERETFGKAFSATRFDNTMQAGPLAHSRQAYRAAGLEGPPPVKTLGWQPTCKHDAPAVSCIVLDPFSGAGTVPLVADKLNRRGIGLELKADYCRMAHHRCYDDAPLLSL